MTTIRDRFEVSLPRIAVVAHDLCMVWLSWYGLHRFRYAIQPMSGPLPAMSVEMLLVLCAQGLVFWRVGLYRGVWRFASVPDLVNIMKAALFGLLAIIIALFFYNRLDMVPRTVLVLYPVVLSALLGMPRLLYRSWKDATQQRDGRATVRVLILGAGEAGETLVRDLRRASTYQPVGFLDDAARLHGGELQGLPILGSIADLEKLAPEVAAQLAIIALPELDAEAMRAVVEACEKSGLPFRMVPRLDDVLSGRSRPGELKEVAIEDLLGRQPVKPDWRAIRAWLGGRSVLVTGAGGSIGSELCRQCARHGARTVGLLEIDELALMTIEAELRRDFPQVECIAVLGDCGDPAVMRHALERAQPQAVFHAAAYKQVPLLEAQLREAVRNNVLATATVAQASREAGVESCVLISTDKAVDPANVLGATKRMAEMVCQRLAVEQSTRFVTVRFGNVLDSAGSVVPLFREQIRNGGPVTVTHADVTRFFMTIPEACQLILQASAIGAQQAVYTLDMGEPVPIRLLAEQMIRLAGKQPGTDIRIEYTGLRPGEKLHERLFAAGERHERTSNPLILRAVPRENDGSLTSAMLDDLLRLLMEDASDESLLALLRRAVPEYTPDPIPVQGVVSAT